MLNRFRCGRSVFILSEQFYKLRLSKCFTALREDDYILLEQEGAAFMPYLIIKVCDTVK